MSDTVKSLKNVVWLLMPRGHNLPRLRNYGLIFTVNKNSRNFINFFSTFFTCTNKYSPHNGVTLELRIF